MYYFVTLNEECNLKCQYCYGKWVEDLGTTLTGYDIDYSIPINLSYDMLTLKEFCKRDPESRLIFYGGEPTLSLEKIREIMDTVPAKEYMIHTNGLLLDRLEPEYTNKFTTILVSIDGDEELTDRLRSRGTHQKIIQNLKTIQENGYQGEVVARMTVTQETDIEKQVRWLLFNNEHPFQSIHWQLDALFWKNDFHPRKFKEWADNSYNPGVNRLAKSWVDFMNRSHKVLRIYPFVGPTQSLLLNEETKLRCGAGWISFNIQTDGNITPCPAMVGMKDYYLGNIVDTDISRLKDSIKVSKPCINCNVYLLCGGRCLYANLTKLWGEEGFSLVCETVMNLLDTLRRHTPRIKDLISKGVVALDDFRYPQYNSCEIIP
ncbi:MAG: TIGR04084 family radical SAM/SPASM domain-containing protein [Candidatus Bathyarchaeota archaeon]|nr:MAG: TIGR04084 family radical SAM/SPASM domain-containing protein [Candidatus Bathyarchaeota archaeon]